MFKGGPNDEEYKIKVLGTVEKDNKHKKSANSILKVFEAKLKK